MSFHLSVHPSLAPKSIHAETQSGRIVAWSGLFFFKVNIAEVREKFSGDSCSVEINVSARRNNVLFKVCRMLCPWLIISYRGVYMSLLNMLFNTVSHFFLDNSSFISTVYRSTNLACRTLSNNSFWTFQSQIPNSSSPFRRHKYHPLLNNPSMNKKKVMRKINLSVFKN